MLHPAQATQAQIVFLIRPHVLLGDDVVDLMRQKRGSLRQATVFTGVLRSPLYPRAPRFRLAHEAIRRAQYASA